MSVDRYSLGSFGNRLSAFRRRRACRRLGHVRPEVAWYAPRAARKLPCPRCGELVVTKLDMSGHP